MRSPENILRSFETGRIPFTTYVSGSTPIGTDSVDTTSYAFARVVALMASGLSAGSTVRVIVQESEDGAGGWTDVSGSALDLTTATDTQSPGIIRLTGRQRYLRLRATITGATAAFGAFVELYGPHNELDDGSVAYTI